MDFRYTKQLITSALMCSLLLASEIHAAAFTVTKLGDLAGGQINAINASGQMVGTYYRNTYAALWQAGSTTAIDLGTLGGNLSQANAINDKGQVVGWANTGVTSGSITIQHAALWQAGSTTAIDLGTLGGNLSQANAINASGQVVGYADISSGYYHAALWQAASTTAIDLGTLGVPFSSSYAKAINASGQVVGYVDNETNQHAVLWQTGSTTPIDLGIGEAFAINASGQVVGCAYTTHTYCLAALWQAGSTTPIILSLLPGFITGQANAINDKGQVVGSVETSNADTYAALWQAGSTTPIDLNTLISASALTEYDSLQNAIGINAQGQIIASGYAGEYYLLTPNVSAVNSKSPLLAVINLLLQ